jgi:hypothetical protein
MHERCGGVFKPLAKKNWKDGSQKLFVHAAQHSNRYYIDQSMNLMRNSGLCQTSAPSPCWYFVTAQRHI